MVLKLAEAINLWRDNLITVLSGCLWLLLPWMPEVRLGAFGFESAVFQVVNGHAKFIRGLEARFRSC